MLPISVCREMTQHGRLETQMHSGRCHAREKRRLESHVNTIPPPSQSRLPAFAGPALPHPLSTPRCFRTCGRSLSPSFLKLLFSTSPLNGQLQRTSFVALGFKHFLLLVVCLSALSSLLFYEPFICSVHIHDGRPDPRVSGPGRQSLLEQAHQRLGGWTGQGAKNHRV